MSESGDLVRVVFASCGAAEDDDGWRAVARDREGRWWVHTWSIDRDRALKVARAAAIAGSVDPAHWGMR